MSDLTTAAVAPIGVKWLQLVYIPYVRDARQQDVGDTVPFMGNCSVHDSEQATAALAEQNIPHEFFPPYCTPILQPCDQNINLFKMAYEWQWREWTDETDCREDNVTRYGNQTAADKPTCMTWVGRALSCITEEMIDDSW